MAEDNDHVLSVLKDIRSLRELLKTEVSIGKPVDRNVKMDIQVYNDAPSNSDGGEVVFMGVGLVIVDGRDTGGMRPSIRKLNEKIKASRPSDNIEARRKYDRGDWYSGAGNQRFPAFTSDENQHGQILFPGESVLYELTFSEDTIPYLDIRVEGSISRRHLLHISKPLVELNKRRQPMVEKTFRDLDEIDLYSPLVSLAEAIPELTPNTTLADIDSLRDGIEKAVAHVKATMPELNKVYHAAPNQELRDLMKQHIGKYLTTSEKLCNAVLTALSGSNREQMKTAAEELKAHLLTHDEVKKAKAESMSRFGIDT